VYHSTSMNSAGARLQTFSHRLQQIYSASSLLTTSYADIHEIILDVADDCSMCAMTEEHSVSNNITPGHTNLVS